MAIGGYHRAVRKSGGYFIYASTVIKFIDEEYESPAARLDQVLDTSNSSLDLKPFAELDQLYIQILSSCPTSHLPMLKLILGYMVMSPFFSSRRLRLPSMQKILDLAPGQMKLTLRELRSLVSILLWPKGPTLFHASFGDFLLNRTWTKYYHIDFEEWIYATFHCVFSLACRLLGPHNYVLQHLEGQSFIF